MSVTSAGSEPATADKGLKTGALGLLSSVIIGVASADRSRRDNPPGRS